MSRSMLIGLSFAAAVSLSSAVDAAPMAPSALPDTPATATQIYYGYGCPPGYKVTSYGGCKLSHYLRHHPGYGYHGQYGIYFSSRPYYHHRYYRPYDSDEGDD